jgi:hypothetical protein
MKPRKHIHVKYYWKTYFKSIGTLSQTFKNHIHNKKEIQDQYPRENEVLFTGEYYFSDKLKNKTCIAYGFRKYENVFPHEYHIPIGRCPQGICYSCVNTFSYFPHQHAINVYYFNYYLEKSL